MNKLSALVSLIVLLAIGAAFFLKKPRTPLPSSDGKPPTVTLQDGTLIVSGSNVRLKDINARIKDPEIFRYLPDRNVYFCNANLDIHGTLQIGELDGAEKSEVLEIQTFACGDRSIQVREGGTLRVYNSEIATVLRTFDEKLCSKGYSIFGEGTLNFDHADIKFMSGSIARPARRTASGSIVNSRFVDSDGNSFFAEDVDGKALEIRNTEFVSRGNYGFVVSGPGRSPLQLVKCKLHGAAADLHHAGSDAEVVLLDCDFRKDAISFNQLNGAVTVKWTVDIKVLDAAGQPVPITAVTARSEDDCGLDEVVTARTDIDGRASIVLTEFVASPFRPKRYDRINNMTPHRLRIISPAGELLGERRNVEVSTSSTSLTIQLKPQNRGRR